MAAPRALIQDVQDELARLAGADLLSITFLRDFVLPDGRRSLSYRLTVGASDRTLTLEEAGAIRSRVIESLRLKGYELRL